MTVEPDPKVCRGAPRIRGTRLTVYNIVLKRWLEPDRNAVCDDYELSSTEVEEARAYCASNACIFDSRRVHYCSNCVLDELIPPLHETPDLASRFVSRGAEALRGDNPFARGWEMAKATAGAGALEDPDRG